MEKELTRENDLELPIREFSRITGVSPHTLRIWERRYGVPKTRRLPSGHRRYLREEIPRIKAVACALDAGYRPGKIIHASLQELEDLINVSSLIHSVKKPAVDSNRIRDFSILDKWMNAVRKYNEDLLSQEFHYQWQKMGPLNFVQDCITPFIYRVGLEWETGELSISQEHFVSARLGDFLGTMWRKLNERNQGPVCVLANLPDEPHSLGLQMAAVLAALNQKKVVFLGRDTPVEDIIFAVEQCNAELLGISISCIYDAKTARIQLKKLRQKISQDCNIIVGGEGAQCPIPGILKMQNLSEFFNWLQETGKTGEKAYEN